MFAMTLSMEFDIEIVKFNFEAMNHRICCRGRLRDVYCSSNYLSSSFEITSVASTSNPNQVCKENPKFYEQ
ncbi:hypothetical protein EPI10_006530 [Gossypium australe]|uniref:Uncharacterized protein n=1 Tax=Gossypium australe TaxID=47621 RepID=A0A5B6WT32_9ROSI|nr:hypothetical protein EPI10_006530 [Gossypium australe]